jgi:hypothetical protein
MPGLLLLQQKRKKPGNRLWPETGKTSRVARAGGRAQALATLELLGLFLMRGLGGGAAHFDAAGQDSH